MKKKHIYYHKVCYVYIVQCGDGTLYTGITNNLRRRIHQHNGIFIGGSKYVRSRRPAFLVHLERFESRTEAGKREREIKSMFRSEKKALIKNSTKEDILGAI